MSLHPGSIWLDAHWDELESYNNQWVAANQERLVASEDSLTQVVNQVLRQGFELSSVTFAFITFDIVQ